LAGAGDVEFCQSPRAVRAATGAPGEQSSARRPLAANHSIHPIVEEIFDLPAAKSVCDAIGLENLRSDNETIILLSKYPGAPPLYFHQDLMNWDHASATTPWPTRVFLNYYTVDTDRSNGCLRVIPGSHRKRHRLHDVLPDAHGQELTEAKDLSAEIFGSDIPDAIDVPLAAGDLIIGDARLLHAAWPNTTDTRRTCVLAWHNVFDFPSPPSWWTGDIPDEVQQYSAEDEVPPTTRKPRRSAQHAAAEANARL
jgi:phytanoyl-CoA hydroxylase